MRFSAGYRRSARIVSWREPTSDVDMVVILAIGQVTRQIKFLQPRLGGSASRNPPSKSRGSFLQRQEITDLRVGRSCYGVQCASATVPKITPTRSRVIRKTTCGPPD